MRTSIVTFKDKFYLDAMKIFKDYAQEFSTRDIKLIRKDLLRYLLDYPSKKNERLVLALLYEEDLTGIIICHHDHSSNRYFEIDWLAIKKLHQNKGYGGKLIKNALKHIKGKGYKHVYLKTSNERYNEKTKRFYKNLGFKRIGKFPRFYSDSLAKRNTEDCIIYSKDL